jgi:argonaute-like protein implicated in RNA metabolism and viral defense
MDKKKIPLIHAEKTKEKDIVLDSRGFFIIEIRNKSIFVEYYTNVYKDNRIASGNIQKVFVGKQADALCDTIAKHIPDLTPEHYLYLGRELKAAEFSIKQNEIYVQGGC